MIYIFQSTKYHLVYYFLLFFIVTGCNVRKYVEIEVLSPPNIAIDQPTRKVTVLHKDSSINYKFSTNSKREDWYEDSIYINESLRGAAFSLTNADIFDTVVIKSVNTEKYKSYKDYCTQTESDLLVLLNTSSSTAKVNVSKNLDYVNQNGVWVISSDGFYKGEVTFTVYQTWKIAHCKSKKDAVVSFTQASDYWETKEKDEDSAVYFLPDPYELSDVAYISGVEIGDKLVPQWTKVYRQYYLTGNDMMDVAQLDVVVNDWEKALKIWDGFKDNNKKRLAKLARYNMALCYEMMGDLQKAYEMASSSYQAFFFKPAYFYMKKLEKRLEEQEALKNYFE